MQQITHRGMETDKPVKQMNTELVNGATKALEKSVIESEDFVARAKAATEAIEWLAIHYKKDWMVFRDQLAESLSEIKTKRAVIEIETKLMLSSFRDVRQFFMDDKHPEQCKRLAEFVSLCERLKALKDSGFLDTVADTILKLSN